MNFEFQTLNPELRILNSPIMTITDFYNLEQTEKRTLLRQCCGSEEWVNKMLAIPPAKYLADLLINAERIWYGCNEDEWKEAFTHHPKIGDVDALKKKFFSDQFAEKEQSSITEANEQTLKSLAEGNRLYELNFGYIFIVCATGKSAEEMLGLLNARLHNDPKKEISVAMEEQHKITRLRLQKLFDV